MIYFLGAVLVCWTFVKLIQNYGTINWPPTMEKLANWAQIVIAYSAIFAIAQYAALNEDRSDTRTKTVLELVGFFREKVIASGDLIKEKLKKEKLKIPGISFGKNARTLNFTSDDFFNKFEPIHKLLLKEYGLIISENIELEKIIRSCLNETEEFSIGVLNTNSQDHPAVSSIKKPFVEGVETFTVPLYYHIGVLNDKFEYTSSLYKIWKEEVGYLPYTERERAERYNEVMKLYRKIGGKK